MGTQPPELTAGTTGPNHTQLSDLDAMKQEVSARIQPLDLSLVKQESPGKTLALKQEKEEQGEEGKVVSPLGQLADPMDTPDLKTLVDDLVLIPKAE
jgi:hypothetical protein